MRRAVLASIAAMVWAMAAQAADPPRPDRPLTLPTRDVDVIYRLGQIHPATEPRVIEQRLRWNASAGLMRVDPPTPGLYVILDTHSRVMSTVREADHSVLQIANTGPIPGTPSGARFIREGEAVVASLPCTEWETTDIAGAPALVCVTADGVMLRALTSGRTVMEATHVTYGAMDPATFRVPSDYTIVAPPARPGK
jgi:hypothetical protein